jgi:hypothetical protein
VIGDRFRCAPQDLNALVPGACSPRRRGSLGSGNGVVEVLLGRTCEATDQYLVVDRRAFFLDPLAGARRTVHVEGKISAEPRLRQLNSLFVVRMHLRVVRR